jgi:hypothetical protein
MRLLVISLLTILAGTLLLAKFRKEPLGKFFTFISWFFIVTGFILFMGSVGGGIYRMSHRGFPGRHHDGYEMRMNGFEHRMPGRCCGPQDMHRGMHRGNAGCFSPDSTMKCCPEFMNCDSAKIPAQKK